MSFLQQLQLSISETPLYQLLLVSFLFVLLSIHLKTKLRLWLAHRKFSRENGCKPLYTKIPYQGPFGVLNILENSRAIRERRFLTSKVLEARKLGYTFRKKFLTRDVISTAEPENIKAILSLRFQDFGIGIRQETLGILLGKGIFTTDGEDWAHSRALVRPNFVREQVADLLSFERHIQTLFKIIPTDGSTIDLMELFFQFTIDSATEFLFGRSTDTLKGRLTNEGAKEAKFTIAFNKAQYFIAHQDRNFLLKYFWKDKEGYQAVKECHDFVDGYVDDAIRYRKQYAAAATENAEKKEKKKYVFLHELAKETTDKIRLRDEILNVFIAGRDTTASLLTNMWFMLAKNPHIYAKLRNEVVNALNGEIPSYQQLRDLKYLRYCMNESLRLHPIVPVNARFALRDTLIPTGGGPDRTSPIFVPKGGIVAFSTYIMHRREDYYGADVEEYRPERWETLRPGWEYLPFNGGPRICLGQQYALTEAGYVTVRLLQRFERCEARDPEPWVEGLTLSLCSRNGAKVGLFEAKE